MVRQSHVLYTAEVVFVVNTHTHTHTVKYVCDFNKTLQIFPSSFLASQCYVYVFVDLSIGRIATLRPLLCRRRLN